MTHSQVCLVQGGSSSYTVNTLYQQKAQLMIQLLALELLKNEKRKKAKENTLSVFHVSYTV